MGKYLNKVVDLAAGVCLLCASATLWAAEQGHGGQEGGGSQLLVLAFFTINFLLFVLVLRRYAFPVVQEILQQRRERIVQALNEAQRAKEEAEALRQEYEQRLAGLAAEQERLIAQTREAAERERNRMLAEARRLAERIGAEARMLAQRELEEARQTLRREVAEHAVRIATDLIRTNLTPADHSRLVQDLIHEVNHAATSSR